MMFQWVQWVPLRVVSSIHMSSQQAGDKFFISRDSDIYIRQERDVQVHSLDQQLVAPPDHFSKGCTLRTDPSRSSILLAPTPAGAGGATHVTLTETQFINLKRKGISKRA